MFLRALADSILAGSVSFCPPLLEGKWQTNTSMVSLLKTSPVTCSILRVGFIFFWFNPILYSLLKKGSLASKAYGKLKIQERHRHRYEFNNEYKSKFEAAGMKCTGINPDSELVEIVEVPGLRWYIGTQFHPEYNSTVISPNPLFMSFMSAAAITKEIRKK
jgi:hypothetical protein